MFKRFTSLWQRSESIQRYQNTMTIGTMYKVISVQNKKK